MQRQAVRIITTLFDKHKPSSRSPLSPIPLPNEVVATAVRSKSIREVAAEARHRMASLGLQDNAPSASRRRSVKLWGSKLLDVSSEVRLDEPNRLHPISFKWVRGEKIATGSRGRVYLGLNATTGEMMVVKQISFDKVEDAPGRPSSTTLKREMQVMQQLSHPNVVEFFGFEEEEEGRVSIFTEYVPGGSIRDNVRKHGKFEEDLVRWFASQILDGLGYLHAQGVVHGDLKSTKILVEPTGTCKIGGLGCSASELRDNSQAVPRAIFWTAPEIIRTQYKTYDSKADIWSLGCVVLEMLTGKRPWSESEAVAVMFKLHNQTLRPTPPADAILSPAAKDFLERCLAVKPGDRPSAVELRQHPFLAVSPDWSFDGFGRV